MQKGTLHLIPNLLAENAIHTIPIYLKEVVTNIKIWYVEEIRSARRFLKTMNREIVIDDLTFYVLNEHQHDSIQMATKHLEQGEDIGMISEAGCPAVADPGNSLVQLAHKINAKVKPHVGPNSILLALIASGFNGQQFAFHGYLPNKQPYLSQKILELERESKQKNISQFFIETPYRNDQMIQELTKNCQPNTKFCLAVNLTGENEVIISESIQQWKRRTTSFHKQPAVFGIYVEP